MSNNGVEVFENMGSMMAGSGLTVPPKSFKEMEGKVIEYVEGKSLKISFPLYDKYHNPAEVVLGGFLPVFFDLTFGPLSYLAAKKPTASLDLNTTFLKPLSALDEEVIVEAEITSITRSYILFHGRAMKTDGEVVCTAASRMVILSR